MRNNLNTQTRSVSANPQKKKKKILKTSIGIAAAAAVTFLLLGKTDAVIFLQCLERINACCRLARLSEF